jgi:NADH-quinone oxidoreductase subunit N
MYRGEFFVLTLFAMLGMMVMVSANHLLTLYLGLELLSLALYGMVALQRDSAVATEAAMKYFVLGALASGMLLYGMSMLYGATGTPRADPHGARHRAAALATTILVFRAGVHRRRHRLQARRVPFHMWVPDVYHGAPTRSRCSSAPRRSSPHSPSSCVCWYPAWAPITWSSNGSGC